MIQAIEVGPGPGGRRGQAGGLPLPGGQEPPGRIRALKRRSPAWPAAAGNSYGAHGKHALELSFPRSRSRASSGPSRAIRPSAGRSAEAPQRQGCDAHLMPWKRTPTPRSTRTWPSSAKRPIGLRSGCRPSISHGKGFGTHAGDSAGLCVIEMDAVGQDARRASQGGRDQGGRLQGVVAVVYDDGAAPRRCGSCWTRSSAAAGTRATSPTTIARWSGR